MKTTRVLKILLLIMTFMTASANAQDKPAMIVKSKSDSTTLVMGDRIVVNVEIVKNAHEGALLTMPQPGADYHGMEMVDCAVDSADLGNSRTRLTYRFTFQAFDPTELLTLPGFVYACEGDTVASDILTFKVLPVELSPELGDPNDIESLKIHPDEQTVDIKSRWYDWIPDWWIWVVVGLACVGLCIALYALYKKNGPNIFVAKKPIPPYELAIGQLNKLKDKHLIENGLAKQFYTEVTDIWRTYLKGRFGINAMEMTTRQILYSLRKNAETHLTAAQMEQILQLSDFVKFAGANPSRDDMTTAYNTIYDFVETTRPQPEATQQSEGQGEKTSQKA